MIFFCSKDSKWAAKAHVDPAALPVTALWVVEEAPEIEVSPTTVEFGEWEVHDGVAVSQIIRVENSGATTLVIESLGLHDPDAPFQIGSVSSTLVESGAAAEFLVTFEPDRIGEFDTFVYIDSNDADEPTTEVTITGSGIGPDLQVSAESLEFDPILVGCEQSLPLTLTDFIIVGNQPPVAN